MKQSEQMQLLEDCKSWFDDKFPEFSGLLTIVPIDPQIKKRRFWGHWMTCRRARLMLVMNERVFFFYPAPDISGRVVDRHTVQHAPARIIYDLEDFVRAIRTQLAHYQHENLGL